MGLVLGAAGIIVTGKIDPSLLERQQMIVSALPLILPLAVIFMPVADLVVTSVRRMRRGKSPFVADARTSMIACSLLDTPTAESSRSCGCGLPSSACRPSVSSSFNGGASPSSQSSLRLSGWP